MTYQRKTKCDFCRYRTSSGCSVTPDSWYCREAQNEFYRGLSEQKLKNKR